jgi:NAD(P)-dependent dehydrogenase (short-subunit alcohol dehydrogenase family)
VANIALEGMARIWAEELASAGRVRVNLFVPGPVNSPSRRKTHPGELPAANPSPNTLAAHYVYLLGPESLGVNGQTIEGWERF